MVPVFDIESTSWTKPIAVGFFDGFKYREFLKETEDDDVLWRFLQYLKKSQKGIRLYAHCAASYDNKFILSCLTNHNEDLALEAGVAKIRWVEPAITFEDSYLLLPFSLRKLSKLFSTEEKKSWEHERNLKPWEMGDELSTFKEYMKRDCIMLSEAIDKVTELIANSFKVAPSISLSTTSAKAFSKFFFNIEKIEDNEYYEPFIRGAIYGGRNEVYKRYGEGINIYDVKSMYVSCYDVPIPIGKMSWRTPASMDAGILAEAKVKVPKDWYIGPLPFRLPDKRLIFPVGELPLGWWDMVELRNAAKLGCDVTIRRQLEGNEEPILRGFGTVIGLLRGEGNEDEFWKMFGLAIVGKMGQSRWREITKRWKEIPNLEGWTPIDRDEQYFQTKLYLKNHPYIKPALSMRVRAEARVRHLDHILEAARLGDIFYGDTDSIFCTTKLPIGEKIGNLTFLGKAERGYFIRQKLYALIQKGRMRQRSSGYSDLQLSEEDFKALLNGAHLEIDRTDLTSMNQILKKGEVQLIQSRSIIAGKESDSRLPCGYDSEPICLPLIQSNPAHRVPRAPQRT